MKSIALVVLIAACTTALVAQTKSPEKTTTISNVKQATTALLMYASDYDHWYPNAPTDSRLSTVVRPYSRTMSIWQSKNPNGGAITMNPSIRGANLTALRTPALTACLYDSKPWPDGSRVVGFVDGHVKDSSKDQWKVIEKTLSTKVPKRAKALPK